MVRDGIKTPLKRKTRFSPNGVVFNYPIKKCIMCGLKFKPNTNVAKYCSLTCQNRNRRQRNAEWITQYNLDYSKKHPEKKRKWDAKSNTQWRKDNPEKIKAQTMAQKIPLKKECEICECKKGLERHHWTYDKPLLVNTLCKVCHRIQHTKHFYQSSFGGARK